MSLALATAQKPMIWNVDPFLVDPMFLPFWVDKKLHLAIWEGGGVEVGDVSGDGNHATFPGGGANPTWEVGESGYHLSFDGGDYLSAPTVPISTRASIGVVVKADTWSYAANDADVAGILVKGQWGGDAEGDLRIIVRNPVGDTSLRADVDTSDGVHSAAWDVSNLDTNTVYEIWGVFNGSTIKLYVNGIERASTDTTGTINNNSHSVTMGAYTNNVANTTFQGDIYTGIFINRDLISAEIALFHAYPYGDITLMEDIAMLAEIAAATGNPWYYYAQQH